MLERIQPQPEPTSTRTAITPWEYGDIPKIVASFATDGYNPREESTQLVPDYNELWGWYVDVVFKFRKTLRLTRTEICKTTIFKHR